MLLLPTCAWKCPSSSSNMSEISGMLEIIDLTPETNPYLIWRLQMFSDEILVYKSNFRQLILWLMCLKPWKGPKAPKAYKCKEDKKESSQKNSSLCATLTQDSRNLHFIWQMHMVILSYQVINSCTRFLALDTVSKWHYGRLLMVFSAQLHHAA